MHFVLVILLLGGGGWVWRHADSPGYYVLAGISMALGIIAALGLAFFYLGLYRDQKK